MLNKYNKGDLVRMRPGFSNKVGSFNYGGAGYSDDETITYTIRYIEMGPNDGMWEGKILYFMSDDIGVVEDVLIGIDELRDRKLAELGI